MRAPSQIKSLAFMLLLLLGLAGEADAAPVAEVPVTAASAIVIDAKTGEVLYEKNADARAYPASLTKMMTCILALENNSPQDVFTVTPDVRHVEYGEMELLPGETLTMGELLEGMMIISDNGAAYMVAKNVGGSVIRFVEMMNRRAKEIGATNTHFANPNGLPHPNHYSTARDMARIAAYAWRNPQFRRLVGTKEETAQWLKPAGKNIALENTNELLWSYEGAKGIKTGYTIAAGGCLAALAERDGRALIAIVMHSDDARIRFHDAAALLDYGFAKSRARKQK